MAKPPRITVKFSHERKVRSLAKNTLGSTRVGRAIRLPVGSTRLVSFFSSLPECSLLSSQTWRRLEKRLTRHLAPWAILAVNPAAERPMRGQTQEADLV